MNRIEIMSEGPFYRSLCVEKDCTPEEINQFWQVSGTERGWQISSNPTFATGQTNPCVCEDDPERMHYLQDC